MLRIDAQHSRAQLIEAACQTVAEQGADGASAREIAERAGVSSATLYRHFANKQALVDAVSVDRWHRAAAWALPRANGTNTLRDIVAILDRFSRMISHDARFIAAADLQVGVTPHAIAPVRSVFEARFDELWAQARAAGSIRRWAEPRDVLELLWAIRGSDRRVPMLATVVGGFAAPPEDVEALLQDARSASVRDPSVPGAASSR